MIDRHSIADRLEPVFEREQARRIAFAVWWIDTADVVDREQLRTFLAETFTEAQVGALVDVFEWTQRPE